MNAFISNTEYGQQTPINLEEYNAYDYVFQIFEEFSQQGQAYFLDY